MCKVAIAGLRVQGLKAFSGIVGWLCFFFPPLRYLIQGLVLEIAVAHHICHL